MLQTKSAICIKNSSRFMTAFQGMGKHIKPDISKITLIDSHFPHIHQRFDNVNQVYVVDWA